MQRSDIYSHFFDLHSVQSQNSNNQLLVAIGQHYGRNIFRFFCRAVSRSSVCFFRRSASLCGPSCSSSFTASAMASSACALAHFEKTTSPNTSLKKERTSLRAYCPSSHDATGFCCVSYAVSTPEPISGGTIVAGPYFAEMDFTISPSVSPAVEDGS